MAQQGSQIGDTGLNNATNQTTVFDGKFDSNIRPKTVNLTLSTYEDPLYGQTTRLKVDNAVKIGKDIMIQNIKDATLGPKIHAANLPAVSNDIKTKLSGIDPKFDEGFNNPAHANKCATGYGQSSDIENMICQLRQTYENEAGTDNKQELFNFIIHLIKAEKTNQNWRGANYTTTKGVKESPEVFYKKLLGKATPEIDHSGVVKQIKNKSKELFDKLATANNVIANNVIADISDYSKPANDNTPAAYQLAGIKESLAVITNIASNTKFNTYLYNLNELEKRFDGNLFMKYKYNPFDRPKPFSQTEIYNYITNANPSNVASRFASTALSTTGTGLSTMGKSALNMANSAPATQTAQQVATSTTPAPQVATSTAPTQSVATQGQTVAETDKTNLETSLLNKLNYDNNGSNSQKAIVAILNTLINNDVYFPNVKANLDLILDKDNKHPTYKLTKDFVNNNTVDNRFNITLKNGNTIYSDEQQNKFRTDMQSPPPKKGFFSSFFGRGGKSKKNKKSHSKKQKKSSRKQQKKRKSAKK
jgi:hypothetical protein